ncbi:polymeric immunoglobulin receptor-like [Cebidichthys violaceus]|uniref:polymeric immunoglobulin receptor-like n=1 Tax=Cebidichthys violaceus TaxID=271503 RepID=UPI0035CC9EF4
MRRTDSGEIEVIRIRFRMNIFVLFFCFFSALCGGNTAKVPIFTAAEGETGSINCHPSVSGSRKFFCKNECEAEDILIKTDDVRAQSGRFSITYRNDSSGFGVLTVIFTNLTKSDSGRYRCGLGKTLVPDSYNDFEVRVSDAALQDGNSGFVLTETEGGEVSRACSGTVYGKHKFFCRGECNKQEDILIETDGNRAHTGRYSIEYIEGSIYGLYVTIKQVTKSDTGRYRCGYGRALSPDSYSNLPIIVIDGPKGNPEQNLTNQLTATSHVSHPGYFWPLVGCVSLVGVLLLVVVLLLLYGWRTRRNFTSNSSNMFPVTYKNLAQGSTCEDSIYENSTF